MNRRTLLAALLSLAACTPSSTPNIASIATTAHILLGDAGPPATGLQGVYATVRTLYPAAISATTDKQVQVYLASAGPLIDDLARATDAVTQASDLRGVEAAVTQTLNVITDAVGRVPNVDPRITAGLAAAQVLLVVLETTTDQLAPSPMPKVGARRAPSAGEIEAAKATLRR